jgi:transcription elongation GreA/GreB family factor/very-short-patch-repair endonuclease
VAAGSEPLRDAFAQLRLKLLDLTGRNRLLNFKHTAGRSLQSVEGRLQAVYERLVEGTTKASIVIKGISEPARSEWPIRDGRYIRPTAAEWAAIQRIPTSHDLPLSGAREAGYLALLYQEDLAKHCRKIEREATLAIEETGANMLFLVLGFLEYPDQTNSDRKFLAPLISIPVSLSSRSIDGQRTFEIEYTGDDIATNLSLHEKLRVDHGLTMPEFDEDGGDVERYYSDVTNIIRVRPGFAFKRRMSLCLLSFSNMLLVRDLDPEKWPAEGNSHGLLDHPVIRQLFEGQQDGGGSGLTDPPAHTIDEGPGANIPLVFDADSSQHRALIDALHEKRNLVIEGPPGTGKSQTITNLIAACIAAGKTVLFVAEKLAALEVVKSRLSLAGLDPFVLELHSSKTNKKRVLEEIGRRIGHRPKASVDLPRKVEQLAAYRKQLRGYVNLMKSVTGNAMGFTLHTLIWRAERHRLNLSAEDVIRTPPIVGESSELESLVFSRRMDSLKHLSAQYVEIGGFDAASPYWGFFPERLLPGDENAIAEILCRAATWTGPLVDDAQAYAAVLEESQVGVGSDTGRAQLQMLRNLGDAAPRDAPLHLVPKLFSADSSGERVKHVVKRLQARLARYRELGPATRAGLLSEADGTSESLEILKRIGAMSNVLGGTLGTTSEMAVLATTLSKSAQSLHELSTKTQEFCIQQQLPFDGSRQNLIRLDDFVRQAANLPESHWRQFNAALTEDGATQALELLERRQVDWQNCHATVNEKLYLDALPDAAALRDAVLTLREGPAWYRIFQKQWRVASAMHRTLLRQKKRARGAERLSDLEALSQYIQLREKWRLDTAWVTYCKVVPEGEPVPLEGYLAIARWADGTRKSLIELGLGGACLFELTGDLVKKFRRDHAEMSHVLNAATSTIQAIGSLLTLIVATEGTQPVEEISGFAGAFGREVSEMLVLLQRVGVKDVDFAAYQAACEAAVERRATKAEVENATAIKTLLGDQYQGVDTDVRGVLRALDWGQAIQSSRMPTAIKRRLLGEKGLEVGKTIADCLERILAGISKANQLEKVLQQYGSCDLAAWSGQQLTENLVAFARSLQARLVTAASQPQALVAWSQYVLRRREALSENLGDFVSLVESSKLRPVELSEAYGYATFSAIIKGIFRQYPELARFSGLKQNQIRAEFCALDREIIANRGSAIAVEAVRNSDPPSGSSGARVEDKTEMMLLNHLIPQQRPRVPVRRLLVRAKAAVQTLKPCLMMGPQAVAQFLDPGGMRFDVVIMDEASQLRPEEAIGAIARGKQLVVVGDSKQLPPTTFFARQNQLGEDVEEFTTTEAESILDICTSSFRPSRSLRWHYRSQHHSLIAFSNHHFYKGGLIVCPSPFGQNRKLGVRATYLMNAVYDNQTNLVEAQRVVDAVVEHIKTRPSESLGVVTLNIKQRDLISELLEDRLSNTQGADEYRKEWHEVRQGLFVKNLENVQGDERDAIIISTTFGKPPGASVVRQNFGPISRQGGWRRLNVLFTRARQSISIYTSLKPDDIVVDGTTPEGTKALRSYLEYARSGVLDVAIETGHEPDSDFEVSVIDVLKRMGYEVTPQLGVSGFRIDIAVKHPKHPGSYLAAIECDGAQYHSAQSARDRDRIRQEILESQGWRGRIWRIWSTDWFRAPQQEIAKLRDFLEQLSKTWTPEHSAGDSWVEEGSEQSTGIPPEDIESSNRLIVDQRLLFAETDKEVRIGDTVDYVDLAKAEDVKTVRITRNTTALEQGLIAERVPLAQALMGGVVGDEVSLNVPGLPRRALRIMAIKRDES